MPPIQVSNEQRDAAVNNAADADVGFEFGIVDEAAVEVSPPLDGYAGFTAETKQAVQDGMKQLAALSARYWQPIGSSIATSYPSFNIVSDTDVMSLSVVTFVPRVVMIALNLTAYTNVANTKAGFYVKINGVGLAPVLQLFYNESLSHRAMGGTWVTTLPATGAVSITATVGRTGGTGSIILDAGDCISLSVIG